MLFVFCFIFPSGCAQKPFGPPIEGVDYSQLNEQYQNYRESFESCGTGYDGEVIVSWSYTLDGFSFSGYFKTLLPVSLQFTALTPLKQPLFSLSSDGSWFQTLDISKRIFRKGSLRSFAVRHEIPENFVSGEWGTWLTGRPLSAAPFVISIAKDNANRGIWFSVADNRDATQPQEHVLVELGEQKILERAIIDKQGKISATIHYADWQRIQDCLQPMTILISGLTFGAEATLHFSDVQEAVLNGDSFNLPIPPGYSRQFLP